MPFTYGSLSEAERRARPGDYVMYRETSRYYTEWCVMAPATRESELQRQEVGTSPIFWWRTWCRK